jgi:hypothetical protein
LWGSTKSASEWTAVPHNKEVETAISIQFQKTTVHIFAVLALFWLCVNWTRKHISSCNKISRK